MKEKLKDLIVKTLNADHIDMDKKEVVIEIPKDSSHGDYATNVAMQLARTLKKSPKEIATNLITKINADYIEKVEIAGPGFINFYIKNDYLYENINTILEMKDAYGSSNVGNGLKVNIEYVSANPTGILHLGHARGASYGDSLSRILSFTNFDVTREYYINDAGNQIVNLQNSIKARYEGICGRNEDMPEDGYYGKEIIDIAYEVKNEYGNDVVDIQIFRKKGLDYLLRKIKEHLKNFRVEFDVWKSEQSIYDSGMLEKTYKLLGDSGYTYEEDGAVFLKTSDFGDEKDRVLIKKDKTNTYLLPDIAYHKDKYDRGFEELIDVFGADHHGYIPRLKASIAMLGNDPDKLDVQILQMVRLVRGKEEVKMSKRTGNAVTIEELMEEVGIDATRYFFSSRSLDTQLDFDLELATKTSNENPVYYIEYAYARICSILEGYKDEVVALSSYQTLTSEYVKNLLSKLYEFTDVVKLSAIKRSPHIIANYAYDLAGLFHTFYAHEKVLNDDVVSTKERINLISATAITIKNALNLIGVVAKEKM